MLRIGERIGVWSVDRRCGETARSAVFRCHNAENPEHRIAIKALDPTRAEWPTVRERLLRESETWFSLEHPYLPRFRGYSPWGPIPYLEMEWIEGPTLWEIANGKPVPAEQAVVWLGAIARAIAALHARGLKHRDIKLDNLRMRGDHAALVDIGTATAPTELDLASWAYAPPELGEPRAADAPNADLYALGVCTWELLRGVRAYSTARFTRFSELAEYKRAVGPMDPGPKVPIALRKLVRELTHPNMSRRTRTATQLIEQLDEADLESTDPQLVLENDSTSSDPPGPKSGDSTWVPPEDDSDAPTPVPPPDPPAEPTDPPPEPAPPEPSDSTPVPARTAHRSDPRLLLLGIASLVVIALIAAALVALR